MLRMECDATVHGILKVHTVYSLCKCRSSAAVQGAAAGLAAAIPALPAVEDAARASATEALLQTLGPSQPSHINAALLDTLSSIHLCLSQGHNANAAGPTSTAGSAAKVECTLFQVLSQSAAGMEGLARFCREMLAKLQSSSGAEALPEADASSLAQEPAVVEAALTGERLATA